MLAVRAMKLFWSDALSVFSAILDSTFDRWHDSAHAWDQKNNMADFMGDEAKKIQYFPDGSLLNTMIISIIDSEKRYTDILKEPYTVYLIETKWVFVFRGCIKVWTCQVSPLKIDLSALFWSFDALILICYDLLEALCGPKYIVVGNPKTSRICIMQNQMCICLGSRTGFSKYSLSGSQKYYKFELTV